MGTSVLRGVHTEAPAPNVTCGASEVFGESVSAVGRTEEKHIEEGHLMPDHVHMPPRIPPKYAASQMVGFIKGKSAIHVAWTYGEHKRNFVGQHI